MRFRQHERFSIPLSLKGEAVEQIPPLRAMPSGRDDMVSLRSVGMTNVMTEPESPAAAGSAATEGASAKTSESSETAERTAARRAPA